MPVSSCAYVVSKAHPDERVGSDAGWDIVSEREALALNCVQAGNAIELVWTGRARDLEPLRGVG
jgi:hypothetical protein